MEDEAKVLFRMKVSLIGMCMTILLLLGLRIYLVQELSTQGIDLQKLQDQIKQLDTQNMELKAQILEAESYQTIDAKAKAQGFVDGSNHVLYLK